MAELDKCFGNDCPAKEICVRYTSPPNDEMQYYFLEPPFKIEDDELKCDMFWGEDDQAFGDKLNEIVNE